LEGQDFTYVPPLPSGPNRPGGTAASNANARAEVRSLTNGKLLSVPIWRFGVEGQPWKGVYPCFTYEVIDLQPRFDETYRFQPDMDSYGVGDGYLEPIDRSAETLTDTDGTDLGSTARLANRRPIEQPMDFIIEVRCYAKDDYTSAALVNHVYNLFLPRHFLRVAQEDGSYRSWDLLFQSFQDLDRREAVIAGAAEREWAKVWTYKLEGYMDTTKQAELTSLIRGRRITTTLE
jgi:hypothetical protein